MPELQLKVVKNTGDGIWGKALNNFNKVLYSSGGGLFNIVINSKRNSLLRASNSYEEITTISNEKKRNTVVVNLKRVTSDQAKRIMDFLSGTIYAIKGNIQKIGSGIFLCTPNNINVQGKITDETEKDTKDKDDENINQ